MDVPKCYSLGIMMKAITYSKIHQNLLKYWFSLQHFAMDDPVVVLEKKKKRRSKPSDKPGRFLLHDFFQRNSQFSSIVRRSKVLFLAVVSTVNDFLFFRNFDRNFNRNSSKVFAKFFCHLHFQQDCFESTPWCFFCWQMPIFLIEKQMAMNSWIIQIRKATDFVYYINLHVLLHINLLIFKPVNSSRTKNKIFLISEFNLSSVFANDSITKQ